MAAPDELTAAVTVVFSQSNQSAKKKSTSSFALFTVNTLSEFQVIDVILSCQIYRYHQISHKVVKVINVIMF